MWLGPNGVVSRRLNDGDHTARRRLAGVALGTAAGRAEGTRGMPILTRIQGIMREAVGWPETMATATMAVAGARLEAGAGCIALGEDLMG